MLLSPDFTTRWANGAKGEVDVFYGKEVNPEGIWKGTEEPILKRNGVKINEHNAYHTQERMQRGVCPPGQPDVSCGTSLDVWQ